MPSDRGNADPYKGAFSHIELRNGTEEFHLCRQRPLAFSIGSAPDGVSSHGRWNGLTCSIETILWHFM